MSLSTCLCVLFLGVTLNILWIIIEKKIDAEPSAPNYRPDDGVDEHSLAFTSELMNMYGVIAEKPIEEMKTLPKDICKFFNKYQRLRMGCIIHLDRMFLTQTYVDNPDFIKIGLMSEEDDLLVRKFGENPNIYIVGAEDRDPKNPELFATSFKNLLAIAWHDNEQLQNNRSYDKKGLQLR